MNSTMVQCVAESIFKLAKIFHKRIFKEQQNSVNDMNDIPHDLSA